MLQHVGGTADEGAQFRHHIGGPQQRVAAALHGCRAGVRLHAPHRRADLGGAPVAREGADGLAAVFEFGRAFDMHFH